MSQDISRIKTEFSHQLRTLASCLWLTVVLSLADHPAPRFLSVVRTHCLRASGEGGVFSWLDHKPISRAKTRSSTFSVEHRMSCRRAGVI